ncbi:tetratricopeptide repeat protein [Rhodophyticola sp. CCM32]|uniref:tetratricopeptide repeat protein n=1 Tax=Rhodophyticola sp. CCM32 TaxID=2916397 RepID=UPI00107F5D1B|nr:tetratricopeptide repeat protein [Rhodophyticola sp. CCM32]QBY01012.1 tetratricopeptide repeat protein [Rhodophyticola sp. CCM32]
MTQDIFGQTVTLAPGGSLESWNATQMAFLAHSAATPTHLAETLTTAPDFALGHAVKAMFYLLLGRRELVATAQDALTQAKSALTTSSVTRREQRYVQALDIWMQGHPKAALDIFADILRQHPDDALAMKLDHALRFMLGDSTGMRRMIETVMPAYGTDHAARGYLLGCHAFTLEETGEYAAAQAAGRAGLELCPDDAWGLHAVAHVHDMTADAKGGLQWLTGREAAWAHCNNFRYHVWWHKALMHLDLGQIGHVLDLYDTEIRREKTDDYRDISNATSLLSRLELEGVNVGDRWEELAEFSAKRTEDGCLIFADLHYLLALVGDHRDQAIRDLMGRLHRDAARAATDIEKTMANPGLSAAAGLEAFGEGRYGQAFLALARARKTMQQAGGSHAQRDVFERLTIDAGIRAGFLDEAEGILADRTARRDGCLDGYALTRQGLIEDGRDAARVVARMPAE